MAAIVLSLFLCGGVRHELSLVFLRLETAPIRYSTLVATKKGQLLSRYLQPGIERDQVEAVLGPPSFSFTSGPLGSPILVYPEYGIEVYMNIAAVAAVLVNRDSTDQSSNSAPHKQPCDNAKPFREN